MSVCSLPASRSSVVRRKFHPTALSSAEHHGGSISSARASHSIPEQYVLSIPFCNMDFLGELPVLLLARSYIRIICLYLLLGLFSMHFTHSASSESPDHPPSSLILAGPHTCSPNASQEVPATLDQPMGPARSLFQCSSKLLTVLQVQFLCTYLTAGTTLTPWFRPPRFNTAKLRLTLRHHGPLLWILLLRGLITLTFSVVL